MVPNLGKHAGNFSRFKLRAADHISLPEHSALSGGTPEERMAEKTTTIASAPLYVVDVSSGSVSSRGTAGGGAEASVSLVIDVHGGIGIAVELGGRAGWMAAFGASGASLFNWEADTIEDIAGLGFSTSTGGIVASVGVQASIQIKVDVNACTPRRERQEPSQRYSRECFWARC
jgi:hypothetical protein